MLVGRLGRWLADWQREVWYKTQEEMVLTSQVKSVVSHVACWPLVGLAGGGGQTEDF